jgi:glycosyltransferase involved in cell wall biosynthesis
MKIAIINNLYKPYQKGGAEKFCEEIVKEIKAKGLDCFIISTKTKNQKNENKNPRTYYINSSYYNLNNKGFLFRFFWQIGNIFNFFQGKKIRNLLEKESPDIIISNNLMGKGLLTFGIIKKLKIKHVHILHDIQLIHPSGLMIFNKENKIRSLPAKIYQSISKKLSGSPCLIISPSKWLMEEHVKRGFFKLSKKIIQRNPFNIESKDFKKIIKDDNITRFLFVGQIESHKGIIFLLESFKEIKNDEIELAIIGDGSLINKVRKIAPKDKRIRILGKKNKEEVYGYMGKSDCLTVPSLCYENSPTVIYEAKNFGLPIIASDIGGIGELISLNDGLLFEPGNKEDLKNKLKYFLENKSTLSLIKKEGPSITYINNVLSYLKFDK